MNYGRFFVLDTKDSDIANGIAVFNYRGVKYKKDDGRCDDEKDTPKYPFYVTMTPKGVFFYMHYAIKPEDYNELEKDDIIHQNSIILALPTSIGSEVKDNLTERIDGVFAAQFPYNNPGNHVYGLIANGLKSTEDSSNNKGISYSSLEIFGVRYKKPEGEERPIMKSFLRKFFLDFIFDLEHSAVFENAACYDEVRHKLYNNFLFEAISNKAEYYYQRKLQLKLAASEYPWEGAEVELFYADYYTNAEKRWVDTIANHNAEECFFNSGWFDDVEVEMDKVYMSGRLKYKLPKQRGKRQEWLSSAKRTKSCNEFIAKVDVKQDLSEYSVKVKDQRNRLIHRVQSSARIASNWYIKKYDFAGVAKIWYGKGYKVAIGVIVAFVVTLCASLLLPSFVHDEFGDQLVTPLAILLFGIGLWLMSAFIPNRRFIKRIGLINSLMPRLFASILAAWFTLAIGEDIFKGFFDNEHNWWISGALLCVLAVFVFYEIGRISPYLSPVNKVIRSGFLVTIAFVYAFVSGIMIIHFFGGTYIERSDYIDEFYVNKVFPETPDYYIHKKEAAQVLTDILYGTIARYDKILLGKIVDDSVFSKKILGENSPFLENIKYKNDSLNSYYPTKFKNNIKRDSYFNDSINIDYRITLLLANQFIHSDSISIAMLNEIQIEGTTIKSRIKRVDNFCEEILAIDNSASLKTFCDSIPDIDSIAYHTTTLNVLKGINSHQVYRDVLHHLKPVNNDRVRVLNETKPGIKMFRDMLLQFTFIAMFIGIFIQLIFEDKAITEPI